MRVAIICCLCLLTGCFSIESGKKFDVSAAKTIRPKVTTKGQVVQLLGNPMSRYAVGGVENWTYSYFGIEAHSTPIAFIPYAGPFLPGGSVSTGQNDSLTIGFKGDVVSSCVVSSTKSSGGGSAISQSASSTSETVDCQAIQ
jgi:outer membrane protein assembly factor BamE (lipoprotein component of BamABCDE complex)